MNGHHLFGSVTRITELWARPFTALPLPRADWHHADLVVGEVIGDGGPSLQLELVGGRKAEVLMGDRVVGALGTRYATLELVGSWEAVADGEPLEILTGGGVLGRTQSRSPFLPPPVRLRYLGHVHEEGARRGLHDYVEQVPDTPFDLPVVLIIGTSMSAGKTTAAKVIVRQLRRAGRRVVGAKLTGAGRYHDILSMADAGADAIFDFVDVGLPTTVVPREAYRVAARQLLGRIQASGADVAVIEAGASPLEPYRGDEAVALLDGAIRCTVLCASDPYAVVGITEAFARRPDVVTGIATNTTAGVELIERLTGVAAVNVRDARDHPRLAEIVAARLGG